MTARTAGCAVAWHAHHLEHLAPVAALMGVPVLMSDAPGHFAAARSYPGLEVRWIAGGIGPGAIDAGLAAAKALAPRVVYLSDLYPRERLARGLGGEHAPRVVYVPHGFSEKRQAWAAGTADQDVALLPGPLAVEQLHAMGVGERLPPIVYSGALRRRAYVGHRAFFDARAAERGLVAWTSGPTVLYAPTWSDAIGSSSFLAAFSGMAAGLPDGWRLVLKLHPHAEAQAPLVDRLVALAARPGIVVLRNESLVFPWLERADAYVGDMSSLAYDYLAYDRPMVFLNRAAGSAADASGSRLFACGAVLGPERYAEAYATVEAIRANDRARYGRLREALDRDLHPPDVTPADVKAGLERACAGPAPAWMRN